MPLMVSVELIEQAVQLVIARNQVRFSRAKRCLGIWVLNLAQFSTKKL